MYKRQHTIRPCNEDISLQEIYDFIAKKYGIDEDITDKLLQAELEFEYRFIPVSYTHLVRHAFGSTE